jgi:hypothetical protein
MTIATPTVNENQCGVAFTLHSVMNRQAVGRSDYGRTCLTKRHKKTQTQKQT